MAFPPLFTSSLFGCQGLSSLETAFQPDGLLGPDDEGCKLLDGFAVFVQLTLAFSALLTLFIKRHREKPQRPVPIWALDVSKQFVGATVIHFLNLLVSYLAGRPKNGRKTNLCVWYFLNVAIDTTLGVVILWAWLHLLQRLLTRLKVKDIRSGYYGPPPLSHQLMPWAKQTFLFVLAESLMKLCVYGMFRYIPFLFDVGEWVLQWTRNNYRHQVVFVMLIFPLIMNAIQFWVVDTIVKVKPGLATVSKAGDASVPNYNTLSPGASLSSDVEALHLRDSQEEQSPLLSR
ncbi:vacuolar membrane protein-domain-containing protein [Spinellus fusiger]|nr:vacuolar membrane protein-domain-containing protein [Spinellus fusiger]